MVTPLQDLKDRWLDPDTVYSGGYDAVPFIVWDLNNDGQYEVSVGEDGAVHWNIINQLSLDELAVINQSTLPIVMGRTGQWRVQKPKLNSNFWDSDRSSSASGVFDIVTFWPVDRVNMFWTNTVAKQFETGGHSGGIFRRNPFKGDFDQFIARTILPLLLKEGVISSWYRWFDSTSRYRGLVSRKSRKPKTPVMKFNMNGREYTYTELMGMLHSGDQQTRAMVTDFLCRSTEPQLKDVQSRLECNKPRPQMWTLPRKVDIGHQPGAVDFRSQKSLNRAWEAEMSRRVSRRRRLARRLLAEATDV